MKIILFILALFFLIPSFKIPAQNQREFEMTEGDTTYIMKRYIFGLLMSGPEQSQDSVKVAEIQAGHMAHLNMMAESGKLIVAGPFEDGGDYRGILVFDVETKEEAIKLANEDPAIKSGRLVLITLPWWAAKGTCLE